MKKYPYAGQYVYYEKCVYKECIYVYFICMGNMVGVVTKLEGYTPLGNEIG